MNEFPFSGTGVALVTPFKTDFTVDEESLYRIVQHVIKGGVDYLVALGTTSEAPVLSKDEKDLVLKTIRQANAGRLPIVLGIGGNNTSAIVKQLENNNLDGIDAILSVTPYYNKPGQQGLFEHYDALARACPVPIILYNVPGRTAVNMKAVTTLSLAHKHRNIVAVKEASGDLQQIMAIIADKPDHFEVISGDDAITLPLLAVGACGVISVAANAFTRDFSNMVRTQLSGDHDTALELQYKMLKLYDLLFAEGSPAGVKAMLQLMDLCENVVRLPLTTVSNDLRQQIANYETYLITNK